MLTELTPEEVRDRFDRNEIVLIDVRTSIEFAFERIRGALNAPMATLDIDKLPTQTDKPIVFQCGSGVRSKKVAMACMDHGVAEIAHMKGGLGAWKQAGLPTAAVNPMTGNMDLPPA